MVHALGNGNPVARPAAHNLGNYHGIGQMVPFVNRTFEWAVVIAAFLSFWSIAPRHCACLTFLSHPKLRKINAVLITPQLIALTLWRLRCAEAFPLGRGGGGSSEAQGPTSHALLAA